ncbi:hypothetical protein PHYSODRAFT_343529 [Phytophthora sojae]|uniref:FYVE-type domain-containing protein n=1 Tax=Phytophthora sojae (strain P6497) TaxID=1094619 RepID=G4YK02_PHYSP|nr:hypothetical protein PHYSODRAFT_343529 [Phytophthora sojae]EGZ27134.1 hypothetical protein PHYSODRAFT_343529 [Phytophthora sojae]|eukprot:XP_009514409.1 hypothetical protein PHYSODRAFT_343529 [Phytophthora sojae]
MAQQTPSFSRSRASQRSTHRLAVPALSMSLRSRRAEHHSVTLGLPQLDRYHDRAEKALTETIAAYGQLGQDVDAARWKCLRARHGVRLFRGRYPTTVGRTPLLCVGALRGSFDDIMEGVYCQSTEEMLLMNAIKCPRLAESAVLYAVQRQTLCEPFAFTGIKWTTIKLSVASNRGLCYFDKMGLVRQTSGKRMAYHVMQSVDLSELPHKAMHKRVQASLCYVFEELEDDMVAVYMQGEMDHAALSYFSTPAVSDLLLAVTNALECARAKKLAEMMAVAPPGRFRRRSSRRCCDVCRGTTSFFESLQECAGCNFKYVCKKCRLKENVLARDSSSRLHLLRAEFCRVCISKMDSTSIDQLRAEAGGFIRTAEMNAAFCEADEEPEQVDVPGSDRSLTAFTLKISAQLQDLSSRSDVRISNLSSMEKVSISEDEDDDALMGEGRDVLNSIGKKSHQLVPAADTSRRSVRSTASTASSSHYHDEEEAEQYRNSLFARLLQVSNQAEATFHLTKEQSLVAHSVFQRNNRRGGQGSDGSVYSQQSDHRPKPSIFWRCDVAVPLDKEEVRPGDLDADGHLDVRVLHVVVQLLAQVLRRLRELSCHHCVDPVDEKVVGQDAASAALGIPSDRSKTTTGDPPFVFVARLPVFFSLAQFSSFGMVASGNMPDRQENRTITINPLRLSNFIEANR